MKIPVGFATIFGSIAAIAAALVPMIGELAETTKPLNIPSGWFLIASTVLGSLVIIGRYVQAAVVANQEAKTPVTGYSNVEVDNIPSAAHDHAEV